jgi:hypothetical protein
MKALVMVTLIIVAILCLIIWLGYSTIKQPQSEGGQANGATTSNQNNYPAPQVALKVGIARIFALIRGNKDEIVAVSTVFIALFTVILGFATVFLYSATRELVKGSEKTAEQQLRAYVIGKNAIVSKFGSTEIIEVAIDIANVGQTPAYKVGINIKVGGGEYPNPKVSDLPPRERPTSVLGPGQSVHDVTKLGSVFRPEMVQAVIDGKAAIYLIGVITYFDVFKIQRSTKLRLVYGGRAGTHPQGLMTIDQTGNEAD